MSPVSEYATVPKGSTLMDVVRALAKAQSEPGGNDFSHRAVLVSDSDGRIVGKLNQLTILQALEFGHKQRKDFINIQNFGFSSQFITSVREKAKKRETSLKETCSAIIHMEVENFMRTPAPGDYVDGNMSLENIVHQFLNGSQLGLFVTNAEDEIVGVLTLTDVAGAIFNVMREIEGGKE
eukprot:NODE_1781_length_551_cov_1.450935_g1767_i0.p1 GENE.NODE_1781_length_551_cov_1.450935_g1767_i0~~NODE_1781_length_551_cov_1.450935_g1767_i0.p1  ORF type:complete len:180 (-),score=53.95 NODE_1781_length_551_cov_1.450935_g1767_i0:11-550(-)